MTRESVEQWLNEVVSWARLGIEAVGALLILFGVVTAILLLVREAMARRAANFTLVRLSFARYLALGLEFQLAADILSTAIAPTWDAIGKLGAIAVIRTALNHFLMREMQEETHQSEDELHKASDNRRS